MPKFSVAISYDSEDATATRASTLKAGATPPVHYDLDTQKPFPPQMEQICSMLRTKEQANVYALYNQELGLYVIQDEPLGNQLDAIKPNAVYLCRLAPALRARQCMDQLSKAANDQVLKENIFNMRFLIKDVHVAEEFIAQHGLLRLMEVILRSTGNLQGYALTALRGFMGYESGLQQFLTAPELIDKLFLLIDPSVLATSCRQALELAFVITNFDGWKLVNKAAKDAARSKGVPPYSNLIELLGVSDFDTAVNTLTLLNTLLDNAPTPVKLDKLLNKWRELGLLERLKTLGHYTHGEWKTQIAIFEAMCSQNANNMRSGGGGGGGKKTGAAAGELEQLLSRYEEQQPLIKILYAELQHYQVLLDKAVAQGAVLNPGAPHERYDKRHELASTVGGPVNLSFLSRSKMDTLRANTIRRGGEQGGPAGARTLAWQAGSTTMGPRDLAALAARRGGAASAASAAPGAGADDIDDALADRMPPPTFAPPPPPPGGGVAAILDAPVEAPPPPPPAKKKRDDDDDDEEDDGASATERVEPSELDGAVRLPQIPPPPPAGPGGPPPPPPGPGGPPPPPGGKGPPGPPPPMMKSAIKPNKPMIKPAVRMRPLHWQRIIVAPKSDPNRKLSIWDSVREIPFNEQDFCNAWSVVSKQVGGEEEDKIAQAKRQSKYAPTRVLSVKRSQSIAVMCSKLPDTEQLIKSIRNLDSSVLDKHLVAALSQNMATAEELKEIREMVHPEIVLDKPEQFCLLLAEIPLMRQRMRCWEFMLTLGDKLIDIGPPIVAIQRACREVAKSPSLRVIFGAILSIGNYMNGGNTSRGQADGFQIEVLTKLADIKDNMGSPLLDHVINMIKDSYPDSLRFPDEIPSVVPAAKVSLKDLAADLRKMLVETKAVKEACLEVTRSTDRGDPFIRIIPPFLEEAVTKLANIRNDLIVAEKVFGELTKYYSSKVETTEAFFTVFSYFTIAFRKAAHKHLQQKVGAGRRVGGGPAGAGQEDGMSSIIANIRAGKARRAEEQARMSQMIDPSQIQY